MIFKLNVLERPSLHPNSRGCSKLTIPDGVAFYWWVINDTSGSQGEALYGCGGGFPSAEWRKAQLDGSFWIL